jgi:hypothetical protein
MGILSLLDFTGRRFQRQRVQIEAALVAGDRGLAASLLRQTILTWRRNWEKGDRGSYIRDIDQLQWAASQLETVEPDLGPLARISTAAAALRAFYEDPANFRVDGRMMTMANASRVLALGDELRDSIRALKTGG